MLRRYGIAAFVAISLLACQRSQKTVIGVVPKATSHVFWLSVQAGAASAGRDLGVQIDWNGPPTETDFSRQIQIVDSLVARHVDGLAVAAADRNALIGPVDRAMKAGIPVTVFDSGLDSENYTTFVATNNYEGGQMAARKLAELIGKKGTVAVVLHAPGSGSTMDRERGFHDVMAKEFPAIRIVSEQFGMSDRAKALAAAENMLAANPDLDGMFASSEPSSMGAVLAIKGRNLAGKIHFVAFDSSETLVDDLKGGAIDALVVQDPFQIGYQAVKTVVDKIRGVTPPKRMDLSARVVTKEDLAKREIQKLLFPKLEENLH